MNTAMFIFIFWFICSDKLSSSGITSRNNANLLSQFFDLWYTGHGIDCLSDGVQRQLWSSSHYCSQRCVGQLEGLPFIKLFGVSCFLFLELANFLCLTERASQLVTISILYLLRWSKGSAHKTIFTSKISQHYILTM